MIYGPKMKSVLLSLLLVTLFIFGQSLANAINNDAVQGNIKAKQVLIVRHAEKLTQGRDPALSERGQIRAAALLDKVAGIKISELIATQYLRTQQTLTQVAEARKLPITIIPATSPITDHIQQVVSRVRQAKNNVLIAGHSNTVPLILAALGVDEKISIQESEYGDLYILHIDNNNAVNMTIAQYGN